MTAPKVSLLVPFRPGIPPRDRAWNFLRKRYAARFPTWEIVTDPGPDGEFSRAGAIAAAAARATGDIFVVADADVWCEGVGAAVARVAAGALWADPAHPRAVVRMTAAATEALYRAGRFSDAGAPPRLRRVACGGQVVLSRAAFFRCPPDPRFVGWGAEDLAWGADLVRVLGAASRAPNAELPVIWHLWHPPGARKVSPGNHRLLDEHVRGPAPAPASTKEPPSPGLPRILILSDVPGWAWGRKAAALRQCLSDRFHIAIVHSAEPGAGAVIAANKYDLLHTFEVGQLQGLPRGPRLVTGITAHVWSTWEKRHGEGIVRTWAKRAVGFHANSRLLQNEIEAYLGYAVHYCPNGVDPDFFRRTDPRPPGSGLVVGFVGKPNHRKGADVVREACKRAGLELRAVERTSKNALSPDEMLAFYQGIDVLAVSSDMDGTPNPALEAAACECAVVSNPIGNMPEFIEPGVNGLLTERSAESLAAALADLAGRPRDEVAEMGRAARRTVEAAWTWRQQAENYATLWTECLTR